MEICKVNPSYVKRVADLLIQMYGLADVNEVKGLQQCLVKLLKLEPKRKYLFIYLYHQTMNQKAVLQSLSVHRGVRRTLGSDRQRRRYHSQARHHVPEDEAGRTSTHG